VTARGGLRSLKTPAYRTSAVSIRPFCIETPTTMSSRSVVPLLTMACVSLTMMGMASPFLIAADSLPTSADPLAAEQVLRGTEQLAVEPHGSTHAGSANRAGSC